MERLHLATPGATYRSNNKKIVKELLQTGNFTVIHTFYNHKKWWQFWKRKKPIAYELMCIRDLKQ